MMRRKKNPNNLWLLLALPVIGAVGWFTSRFLRRRKLDRRYPIPASGLPHVANIPGGTVRDAAFSPAAAQESRPTAPDVSEPVMAADVSVGHALENQPERLIPFLALLVLFLALPVAIVLLAFHHLPVQSKAVVPGGDASRGNAALQAWGCGSCHTIEGVTGANGKVGPDLSRISDQSYIAGRLRNTPDQMIQWIMRPQEISPGVDMPDSHVPESVARDMAAYLYSIR